MPAPSLDIFGKWSDFDCDPIGLTPTELRPKFDQFVVASDRGAGEFWLKSNRDLTALALPRVQELTIIHLLYSQAIFAQLCIK